MILAMLRPWLRDASSLSVVVDIRASLALLLLGSAQSLEQSL